VDESTADRGQAEKSRQGQNGKEREDQ